MLRFLGRDVTEAFTFGLNSLFGFYYVQAPDHVPSCHLGCALPSSSELAFAHEGFDAVRVEASDREEAWEVAKNAVDEGRPLMVQLDPSLLPRYPLPPGTRKPHHRVLVVGYGSGGGAGGGGGGANDCSVLVLDPALPEPAEFPLEAFLDARGADAPWSPPKLAWWDVRPAGEPSNTTYSLRRAVSLTARWYLRDDTGFRGVEALRRFAADLEGWLDLEELPPHELAADSALQGALPANVRFTNARQYQCFAVAWQLREESGGNGAYRPTFLKFVQEVLAALPDQSLVEETLPLLREATHAWRDLQATLLELAGEDAKSFERSTDRLRELVDQVIGLETSAVNLLSRL
ncbi:MAG: hypothetical protein Kow0069_12490 [Promethearchaeota archaeon]